eukprot:TRINITY_DN24663_c0_g1_i1.p1 TRINITY_DN24663_c0_g1~~TRINITY_DN24663_c0_g1_i1.p1  ORF type:complete len:579 (+),score=108.28 TRINITY_DN24663_c0_g1_i1:90-1826(+)
MGTVHCCCQRKAQDDRVVFDFYLDEEDPALYSLSWDVDPFLAWDNEDPFLNRSALNRLILDRAIAHTRLLSEQVDPFLDWRTADDKSAAIHCHKRSCVSSLDTSTDVLTEDTDATDPQNDNVWTAEALPKQASTRDKGRGRPPPGRPPPRGKAAPRPKAAPVAECVAAPGLPSWTGPLPPANVKSRCVVNWQPIRTANQWSGSIWQQVYLQMQQGFTPLPEEELNSAFMQDTKDMPQHEARRAPPVVRRLTREKALVVDILHSYLSRCGIHDSSELQWLLGSSHGVIQDSCPTASPKELPEATLQALVELFDAVAGDESQLAVDASNSHLAPAEMFLSNLVESWGTLDVPCKNARMALFVSQFSVKVAAFEDQLHVGLDAASMVLNSRALPKLLEATLLLGNYVNAESKQLSGALAVTLDSLVKLSHTRSRSKQGGQFDNALLMIVRHLQETAPAFLKELACDLAAAHKASSLNLKNLTAGVESISHQLDSVEAYVKKSPSPQAGHCACEKPPPALHPERLLPFLQGARPRLAGLLALLQDLNTSTAALRKYFAEPEESSLTEMMQSLAALKEALPSL